MRSTASHLPVLQVLQCFCGPLYEPFPLADAYQWKLALHWYVKAMCGSYHATSCIHVHARTHTHTQNLLEELTVSEALGHAGRPDEILAWSEYG